MIDFSVLVAIAEEAGKKILEIYQSDFDVAYKQDNSPVTLADTAAEAIITTRLNAAFPEIPVIAEEAVSLGQVPAPANRFFLVDPLDGSKEFIARNDEFTVNIALIENDQPVAGVVYAPALAKIWWGGPGTGSCVARIVNSEPVDAKAISVRPAGASLCAVGSRSHGSGETDPRLGAYEIGTFRSAGSSLKFCLLAEGEADLYPRFSRTMEWDTAAGDAVLRGAGGRVTALDGALMHYGKRNQASDADFANPHFVAYGDPSIATLGDAGSERHAS